MIKIANAQLWVHDQDEALAFYTEKVGMEVRADVTQAVFVGIESKLKDNVAALLVFEVQRQQSGIQLEQFLAQSVLKDGFLILALANN